MCTAVGHLLISLTSQPLFNKPERLSRQAKSLIHQYVYLMSDTADPLSPLKYAQEKDFRLWGRNGKVVAAGLVLQHGVLHAINRGKVPYLSTYHLACALSPDSSLLSGGGVLPLPFFLLYSFVLFPFLTPWWLSTSLSLFPENSYYCPLSLIGSCSPLILLTPTAPSVWTPHCCWLT